jgi:PAS domain-containing protein
MMIRQIGDGNARKVNQLLLDAFNHIHAGIFIRDNSTGRILFANQQVSERVGQDLVGQDSRILIPDLKSKYEHLEGMRNQDMTNNKITRWRRYIDSVNDIVDITEIQMEWLNGEPVTFVIMRPAQE